MAAVLAALIVPLAGSSTLVAQASPINPSTSVAVAPVAGPDPSKLTVSTTVVASDLGRISAMVAPDDSSKRMFVVDKSGVVRVFRPNEGVAAQAYLDITNRVNINGNERGLLGIATSPRFSETRTLFVVYTRLPDGALTLSRFKLADATQASVPAGTEEVLITQQHAQFSNHNGGQIAFGPDGYLYWSLGDGGGAGDPFNTAQDLTQLLGKILRLDVMHICGGRLYCIPPDNPFAKSRNARPEIWAYGLRNPWRFSFDPADGSLWIGDVGQNQTEEVDRLRSTQRAANLGWSCMEGPDVFNSSRCIAGEKYVAPVFSYQSGGSAPECSVTGGFVYRGKEFADIAAGIYVATDYCTAKTWGIQRTTNDSYRTAEIGQLPGRITTFGVDSAGELYAGTDAVGGGISELHKVEFSVR
ncbi:PQQ-dependent sugar dehydrogenase [Actinopolymorpha alba]|uniref:PQQ-dependent sugar dehydrogenase n=1 Tax=Actinopolymorpha alba TaxID=533267 RepID=UPI00036405B3|nr:PQQ-dependent sugar dehydrogenase [Actinopolymorpha alba]